MKAFLRKLYGSIPGVRHWRELRNQLSRAEGEAKAAHSIYLNDFVLRDHPRYGDPRRLLRYQSQVSSQNGEDGIIHEIFKRIGTSDRIFVEVGVGTGCENNTAFLLAQGWTGFWIDGRDAYLKALEGREDLPKECLRHRVDFVTKENIAGLFGELGVPNEFDLLSLDIDQNTYYAWEGLCSFRPRVIVVEYNAAMPSDVDWKVQYDPRRAWNGTQNFGASLKAYENLGRRFGYSLVGCDFIGINAFFVRNDLLANKFAEPFTAENHHEPPRYALCHRRCHPSTIIDRTISHS